MLKQRCDIAVRQLCCGNGFRPLKQPNQRIGRCCLRFSSVILPFLSMRPRTTFICTNLPRNCFPRSKLSLNTLPRNCFPRSKLSLNTLPRNCFPRSLLSLNTLPRNCFPRSLLSLTKLPRNCFPRSLLSLTKLPNDLLSRSILIHPAAQHISRRRITTVPYQQPHKLRALLRQDDGQMLGQPALDLKLTPGAFEQPH
jgi:hypothetical protein